MEIKTFSHFFFCFVSSKKRVLLKFYLPVEHAESSDEKYVRKKNLNRSWVVCTFPTYSRFVLIYTSGHHTSHGNHAVMLWAYFSFALSLKLEFFLKSLNYKILLFHIWMFNLHSIFQMKLALLVPQSLCWADPFWSFSWLPEFVL